MGLLDDYERLLRDKMKVMPPAGMLDPTEPVAMTAGDELDPTMKARRAEALEVRGAPSASLKQQERLPVGLPMQPPASEPPAGILAPKPPMPTAFAENAPLPPPRPMVPGNPPGNSPISRPPPPAPAMPPPRPPAIGGGMLAGRMPETAPLPPVRPPELGGIDVAASPIIDTPITVADAAPAAAAGGGDILGGILGAAGGIAKMFGAGKKAPAPQARPPQLSPSNAGATVDAEIAQDRAKAPQILAGLLADNPKSLIDPRKQRRA